MANPTYHSSTTSFPSGFTSSDSIAFTVPSGLTDALLVVLTANQSNAAPQNITWNGADMFIFEGGPAVFANTAYFVTNPAPGSANVVVEWSPSVSNKSIAVILITNAGEPDNIATLFDFTHNVAQTVPISINVSTVGSMILEWLMGDHGMGVTTPGGQTQVMNGVSSPNSWVSQASYKEGYSSGTQTISATFDSGGPDNGVYEMAALVIPPPTPSRFISVSEVVTVAETIPLSIGFSLTGSEVITVEDLPFYYDNVFIAYDQVSVEISGDKTTDTIETTPVSDQITMSEPYIPLFWTDEDYQSGDWTDLDI